jgi:hypothetical protein
MCFCSKKGCQTQVLCTSRSTNKSHLSRVWRGILRLDAGKIVQKYLFTFSSFNFMRGK